MVAQIAWSQLSEPCREKVTDLLRFHPDPQIRTLAQASVWPDKIRDPSHFLRAHSRPDWHYIDRLFRPPPDEIELRLGGQIVTQLEKQTKILGHPERSAAEKAVALCWVAHLVGDIHQPLHNSELYDQNFPTGDRGGNLFKVVLGQESIPLHVLWDSLGGRFLEAPTSLRLKSYERWFRDAHPPETFAERLGEVEFQAWSDEGLALAQEAYVGVRLGEPLGDERLKWVLDVSERQVVLAGYRLGAVLEMGLR